MNQQQRDRLIERYIGRRMSPAEEREFLGLLDRDETLRRMMETERTVGATLLRDRDAIPTSDLDTREQLLSMLAALPPVGEAALTAASKGSGLFAGTIVKGTLAALVAGTIIGAGYLFTRDASNAPQPRPHAASTATPSLQSVDAPGSSPSSTPSLAPSPISSEGRDVKKMEEIVMERSKGGEGPSQPERIAPLKRSQERSVSEAPAASIRMDLEKPSSNVPDANSAPAINSAPAVETAQSTRAEEPVQQAPRTRDTMRVNVSINLDRIGKRPR